MKRRGLGDTKLVAVLACVAAMALMAGCGGGTGEAGRTSTITGRVVDEDGRPVRGARVTADGRNATTSSGGAFVLSDVRADDLIVRASLDEGGIRYEGQNVARTQSLDTARSITILMAPRAALGALEGTVRDREGRVLEGASVFALAAGALNSSRAITDQNGDYRLEGLIGGYVYDVNVGGGGYASATDQIEIRSGRTELADFTLGNAGFPTFPAPQNLSAIAWTTPAPGRDRAKAEAYEAVKREFDPGRAERRSAAVPDTRLSTFGNLVEVELEWDPIRNANLLGYEIYRGAGGGTLRSADFYREPLAGVYLDTDPELRALSTYRYAVGALGTRWPDDPNGAGPLSAMVTARTLDDLELSVVDFGPLRFRWFAGSGAERYVVYLYDRFPGYDATSIWNTESRPTTNLFQAYDGPALIRGRTYHYLVLGLADGTASRTLSEVGTFVFTD